MNCTRRKKAAAEIGPTRARRGATEHLSQNGSEESERERGESSPFWYGHVIEFDVIRVSIEEGGGGGGALTIQIDYGRRTSCFVDDIARPTKIGI